MLSELSKEFDYGINSDYDCSDEIEVKSLVEPLAICLIVMGIIILIIAFLGICGACCNSRIILAVVSLPLNYLLLVDYNKCKTKKTHRRRVPT